MNVIKHIEENYKQFEEELNCRIPSDFFDSEIVIVKGGFCAYKYLKDGTIWLQAIAVLKDYQKKGIGTTLLRRLNSSIVTSCYENVLSFYLKNRFYEVGQEQDNKGKKLIILWREM